MGNGKKQVEFENLPVDGKLSWLFGEVISLAGKLDVLNQTASRNAKHIWAVGILILGAVLSFWLKG